MFSGKIWKRPQNLPDNGLSCYYRGRGWTGGGHRGQGSSEGTLWLPLPCWLQGNQPWIIQCILPCCYGIVTCCVSLAEKWLGATKLSCSLQQQKGFGGLALAGSILSYLNSWSWHREPIWENYLPVWVQAPSSSHFLIFPPGLGLCGNK